MGQKGFGISDCKILIKYISRTKWWDVYLNDVYFFTCWYQKLRVNRKILGWSWSQMVVATMVKRWMDEWMDELSLFFTCWWQRKVNTLFHETHGIVCTCAGTCASKFTCAIYCMCEITVFSLFVLLLYISCKEKYMLKWAVSFTIIFIARVRITWWYISCIVEVLFYHTI